MWTRLKAAQTLDDLPVTHAGVLGQVWRGSPRQARLAQALEGVDVRAVDKAVGRAAGRLLGATDLSDVIDAVVMLISSDGDEIVTSDRGDCERLAEASGRHIELIRP